MCVNNTQNFRALFAHLLEDRAPLVIYCTAGKDRTGFACALILHALGVPDDLIAEDYLLTNRFYRRDPGASSDLPEEVRQALASVEASFLAAAFETIQADYGSLETYFSRRLGPRDAANAHGSRRSLSGALIPAALKAGSRKQSVYAAASISASRSAMTSSNAEIAC